jgi:hypothetical protein
LTCVATAGDAAATLREIHRFAPVSPMCAPYSAGHAVVAFDAGLVVVGGFVALRLG